MNHSATLMLACGSMHMSPEQERTLYLITYSVITIWVVGATLDLANLWQLVRLKTSRRFKVIHMGLFVSYNTLAWLLCSGKMIRIISNNTLLVVIMLALILGLPVVVAAHFFRLMAKRRELRTTIEPTVLGIWMRHKLALWKQKRAEVAAQEAAHTGPRCVACREPIESGVEMCPSCGWTQPKRE